MEDIKILRQALPYIKQYRDATFVVKLGGEVITEPQRLDNLAADLSLMYQLSIRIVLIHGGGPQLSETAEKMGITSEGRIRGPYGIPLRRMVKGSWYMLP